MLLERSILHPSHFCPHCNVFASLLEYFREDAIVRGEKMLHKQENMYSQMLENVDMTKQAMANLNVKYFLGWFQPE